MYSDIEQALVLKAKKERSETLKAIADYLFGRKTPEAVQA